MATWVKGPDGRVEGQNAERNGGAQLHQRRFARPDVQGGFTPPS
jgi:hypothetical protein